MKSKKFNWVTKEIGKLLKDIGYDEPCFAYYPSFDPEYDLVIGTVLEKPSYSNKFLRVCLWQEAIEWFREEHKLEVLVYHESEVGWWSAVHRIDSADRSTDIILVPHTKHKTYDKARNKALKDAINFVKQNK